MITVNVQSYDPDPQPIQNRMSLEEHLGYAALVGAGTGVATADESGIVRFRRTRENELDCTDGRLAEFDGKIDADSLFEAILAAENYNRSPATQFLENGYARAYLLLTGHVPDLSIGVSQIKLSIVRRQLEEAAPGLAVADSDVLDYALNDCSNQLAGSRYLLGLLKSNPKDSIEKIIARSAEVYNGGGNPAYAQVVLNAYSLLGGAIFSTESADNENPAQMHATTCIRFSAGSSLPADSQSDIDEQIKAMKADSFNKGRAIHIILSEWEPGPDLYHRHLSELRVKWINGALNRFGLPDAKSVGHDDKVLLNIPCRAVDEGGPEKVSAAWVRAE
jgi:hypothetical protein